jgi:hypothetical protein
MEITRKVWDDGILGQDPVICKIILDNKCLQKVNNFKYFGFEIYHENEKDIQHSSKTVQIPGILNDTFKLNLAKKFSRIQVYNALSLPLPLYRREIWTRKKIIKNY